MGIWEARIGDLRAQTLKLMKLACLGCCQDCKQGHLCGASPHQEGLIKIYVMGLLPDSSILTDW
jgi:hypothetical protein